MATTAISTEILDRLTVGIRTLGETEAWQRWLQVQSQFWHYSANNTLLIGLQRPDATRVAGFRAWQSLGRQVRKGEKGIVILAPMVKRFNKEEAATEGTDGNSEGRAVVGFRPAYVFALEQTDGAELPPSPCHRLQGDAPSEQLAELEAVATSRGFYVEWVAGSAMAGDSINGDTNFTKRRIRVRADLASAQQLKTLAHELGHMLLHESCEITRQRAELEAESVAWIICDQLGIDSSEYTFGYVATWLNGTEKAIEAVRDSAGRIASAARTILSATAAESAPETAEIPVMEGAA